MTPHNLKIFALICQQNARVAAMQAANDYSKATGQTPRYDTEFFSAADELERLSNSVEYTKGEGA